jgi:hypothetical protein
MLLAAASTWMEEREKTLELLGSFHLGHSTPLVSSGGSVDMGWIIQQPASLEMR